MGFLRTSFNIFFQMHFASTRVGRWDVNDDGDDDHDDDNDADDDDGDDDGDDNNYDDESGVQVAEYDEYDEYELKKEGVSEERTDGAYISVKYCYLNGCGGGSDDFDVFFIIFDRNQVEKICNTFVIFNYHKFMRQNVVW